MLLGLFLCLIIATGVVALLLKDAIEFRERRAIWLRSSMGLPLLALTCVALWLLIRYPQLASMTKISPMGADWECSTYGGRGATVCFKRQPPNAPQDDAHHEK